MKRNTSRLKWVLMASGIAAIAVSGAGAARAGFQTTYPVAIGPFSGGTYAVGEMSTARSSPDNVQQIGCSMRQYVLPSAALDIWCTATTSLGVTIACSSNDTRFRDVIQSMADGSLVYFGTNASGQCMYVGVENNSKYPPKQP